MWARQFQTCRRHVRVSTTRSWRRRQSTGPHKTYFQPPPPPPPRPGRGSFWRYAALGTLSAGVGYFAAVYYSLPILEEMQYAISRNGGDEFDPGAGPQADMLLKLGSLAWQASVAGHVDLDAAQELLALSAHVMCQNKVVVHSCSLASNMPCEDVMQSGSFQTPGTSDGWQFAAVFDGHAGSRCANVLHDTLLARVAGDLWDTGCLKRAYRPNDPNIIRVIKSAFEKVDQELVGDPMKKIQEDVEDRGFVTGLSSLAFAGSCALVALFDPINSVVRVANVGDSRAVLGRWDESQQRYIAIPLSIDQTGFNPAEVARLSKAHPGEKVIDPATGRLHGLAVTRAFGDSRWKWPQEISNRAHRFFFGPKPRPDDAIRTPPYLTAEPDIIESKIDQTSLHPDFLIMASDGLWDQLSSSDAVTCIQMWLDKTTPLDVTTARLKDEEKFREFLRDGGTPAEYTSEQAQARPRSFVGVDDLAGEYDEKADTYYDETERVMKWRTTPEHFVVEDAHAGIHLIKNALGGKRRNLFTQVMTMMPPHSRDVRDDISVFVWFFGQETRELEERVRAMDEGQVVGVGQKKGWLW